MSYKTYGIHKIINLSNFNTQKVIIMKMTKEKPSQNKMLNNHEKTAKTVEKISGELR
jgi:hypothetical protein